jgi:hypothetical protein
MSILYNASTSNGIANQARFLTNTNTTTYTAADLYASINTYYHYFVNEILEAMDGWDFQGEIATTDLVASQQEYVFPTDILKVKRVEITYDGTNWYNAEPFDINMRAKATDTTSITNDFSTNKPYFDCFENSMFLYPIPDAAVTSGLKIWYEKEATELSGATDEPVFAEAYHKGLSYGAAKDWFQKYSEVPANFKKAQTMSAEMQNSINRMKVFYNRKTQDEIFSSKVSDGVNYE